jgi:hypothetical protein
VSLTASKSSIVPLITSPFRGQKSEGTECSRVMVNSLKRSTISLSWYVRSFSLFLVHSEEILNLTSVSAGPGSTTSIGFVKGNMVHHHLAYYADVAETPHNISLPVDSDGQLFLNYLFVPIDGAEEIPEEFLNDVKLHGELIRACLEEFATDPKVWPKYAWAGAYHNFFCGKFLNASELRIDRALLRQEPRQLGEVY